MAPILGLRYTAPAIINRSPLMANFWQEFKTFAIKGNVVDLAIGVIIGGAFGKIVDSLVNDVVMPVLGRVVGGLDLSQYFIALKDVPAGVPMTLAELKKAGIPVLAYGQFLTVAINFLLLALVVYLLVRLINRLRQEPAPAANAMPAEPPEEIRLLRDIRDALQTKTQA
jgi:large conductance mechanosensitive channel